MASNRKVLLITLRPYRIKSLKPFLACLGEAACHHGRDVPVPLFVCHANCCRSVIAEYLYQSLGSMALSAGVEVGDELNDRAAGMLRCWGIDATGHRPRQLTRELCQAAGSIFVMGPLYLGRLLGEHGWDLAGKCYLFADPFTVPAGFAAGEFLVRDPSFDMRSPEELTREFAWFQRRVGEIRAALEEGGADGSRLVPASRYLPLLDALLRATP
jgi:Low molecular weight phosphotyrosine protein phosphatase